MAARYGSDVKTLGAAWRDFGGRWSPRVLAAGFGAVLVLRLVLGGWTWRDAVAAAAMLVIYPFGEWAIHVHLLHLPPFRLRGRKVELATSRNHREHHEQPHRLGLILLGPLEAMGLLLVAVPVAVVIPCVLLGLTVGTVPLGAAITGVLTGYALVFAYEWTHFLIHTAYRPRSRYYRAIWRNHRLHHFKNERYWHGITNTVADHALGTYRDQRTVKRSRTARTLHGGVPR
jgi:fatty acid hydroxylase family protein